MNDLRSLHAKKIIKYSLISIRIQINVPIAAIKQPNHTMEQTQRKFSDTENWIQ